MQIVFNNKIHFQSLSTTILVTVMHHKKESVKCWYGEHYAIKSQNIIKYCSVTWFFVSELKYVFLVSCANYVTRAT